MDPYMLKSNYNLDVSTLTLLDSHFGTEIYAADDGMKRYIVKTLPLYFEHIDQEGPITAYLREYGLNVARILKSQDGSYVVRTPEFQLTVQEYIEGETLALNSAPKWFMQKSAEYLGKTVMLLKDYGPLPMRFGQDFFAADGVKKKLAEYASGLENARKNGEWNVVPIWEEQIRHLKRILSVHIEPDKLTYANSHGDFHIGQAIVNDEDLTVIDWSSACRLPICLEVATSYVFASPDCRDGSIDAEGLYRYLRCFTEYFPLSAYDVKGMPYVLYFWHCLCNYRPDEMMDIPESYKPFAELISRLLNWLYGHVDALSEELSGLYQGNCGE